MARDFFQRAPTGSVGPSGSIIAAIQGTLNALTTSSIKVDGIFGDQTVTALSTFQNARGLEVSGTVSDETWSVMMHTAEPDVFQRCLQLTASFEGTGFTHVVGNFDGAGITWGVIGFTLLGGELGTILATVNERLPDLMAQAFGSDAKLALDKTGPATSNADKIAWANEISRGAQKQSVAEPWNSYFRNLGAFPQVQQIQIDRARDVYWSIARTDLSALGMGEELDCALLFDIAVQDGGMGSKNRLANAKAQFAQQIPATPLDKRKIIAQVVADSANSTYYQDVLDRKLGIATGTAKIHGGRYQLSVWGLLNGVTPKTI